MPICTRSKAKKVSDPVATTTTTTRKKNTKNTKNPSTVQGSMDPVVVLSPLRHNRLKDEAEVAVPQPKKATRPRPKEEVPVPRARIASSAVAPPSPAPSTASFRSLRNVVKKKTPQAKAGPQPRLFSEGTSSSSSDSEDDGKGQTRSFARGRLPSSRIATKKAKENVPEKSEFLAPAGPAPKTRSKPTGKKVEKQAAQSLPPEDEGRRTTRSLRPRGKDNKVKPFVNADLANVVPGVLASECHFVGSCLSKDFSVKAKQAIKINKFLEKATTSLADAVGRAKAKKIPVAEVRKASVVDLDLFQEDVDEEIEEEEEEKDEASTAEVVNVDRAKVSEAKVTELRESVAVAITEHEDVDLFEVDEEDEEEEEEAEEKVEQRLSTADAVERTKRKAQESLQNTYILEDKDEKKKELTGTKKSGIPQEKTKSPIKFNFRASAEEEAVPIQPNKKFIMHAVNEEPEDDDDSQDDIFEDVFDKSVVEEGPISADDTYLNPNATFVLKKPKPGPTFNETINLPQPKFGMHIPTFGMHDFNTSKHHTSKLEVLEEEDDNCSDNAIFKLPSNNGAADIKKKKETSSSSSSSAASFKSAISQPKKSFSKVKLAKELWSEKQKQKEENAQRMKEQIIKSKQELQKQKNDEWRLKTEKIRLENEKKKAEALKKLNKPATMVPSVAGGSSGNLNKVLGSMVPSAAGGSSGNLNKVLGPMVPHKAPQIKLPIHSITRLVENTNLTPVDKQIGPMKAFNNKPLQFPNSQQPLSMAFSNPTFTTTPIKPSSNYLQKSQDMFKTPNTSTSFFDITADSGGSTYDITRYEDLDEEMRHRENKPVPKWANNKSEISNLLFKQLYAREFPGPGFPFPSVRRGYKLFRQNFH